jgi:hypothetical protein
LDSRHDSIIPGPANRSRFSVRAILNIRRLRHASSGQSAEQDSEGREPDGSKQHPPKRTVETLLPFLKDAEFPFTPFSPHDDPQAPISIRNTQCFERSVGSTALSHKRKTRPMGIIELVRRWRSTVICRKTLRPTLPPALTSAGSHHSSLTT